MPIFFPLEESQFMYITIDVHLICMYKLIRAKQSCVSQQVVSFLLVLERVFFKNIFSRYQKVVIVKT